MHKKIIFLDVDGILTYTGYKNKNTANIDPEKVKMLAYICEHTNAKIVIISSWRNSDIYTILRNVLTTYNVPVLGDAPNIPGELLNCNTTKPLSLNEIGNYKTKYGTGRGAEVHKYITDNHITQFVILDDEDHDWSDYHLEQHWLQPTFYSTNGGIQPEHVTKAISILNKACF